MTVDVATLVFEFKSDSALTAGKNMDDLIAKGERLDRIARRVKTATEQMNAAHQGAAGAANRAAQGLNTLANAAGVVQRADREVERSAQQMLGLRMRLNRQAAREAEASAREESAAKAAADREAERSAAQVLAFRLRMARQRAREEAAEARQAAAEQAAADREVERSAQQVLQFRIRMARQRAREEAQAAAEIERAERDRLAAVADLERRMAALRSSVDPVGAAQARINAELREAAELYRLGAISAEQYAHAVRVLDDRYRMVTVANDGATKAMRGATLAGLDLSRQFADIGVTAAMGMNPLMILVQQGPQIADRLAMMKMEGIGLGQALGGIVRPLGGILAAIGPLVAVVGAAAAGFGLMNRELQKGFPKDVTDGLGLTEEQLERVKSKTVTLGDVWGSTLTVMGKYLRQGPVGEAIDGISAKWTAFMDGATNVAFHGTAALTAFFLGSYRTIVHNWQAFPAAMGDFFAGAVNLALDGIEKLVNGAAKGMNEILAVARQVNPLLRLVPDIPNVELDRFKLKVSGAGQFVAQVFASNVQQAYEDAKDGMRRIGREIGEGALARARERALEEAGKAAEKRERDRQSQAEKDAKAVAEYIKQLEEEIEAIGLTEIQLGRLAARRKIELALRNGDVKSAERIHGLVLEKERLTELAQALKEAAEAREAFNKANAGAVKFANTPADINVTDPGTTWSDWLNNMERDLDKVAEIWDRINYGVDQFRWSLKNGDWLSAAQGLVRGIQAVQKAYADYGVMGGVAGVAQMAGGMIGGRAGGALMGAGSGAMLGAQFGGLPGAAIGAVVGGIAGFLSGGKSKQQKEQERLAKIEAAQRITDARRALEIRLLELSGKSAEALAAARAAELAKMDASLRALQQQVWAREDEMERLNTLRSFEIQLLEAQGKATEALALQRQIELEAIRAEYRALQSATWAVQDAVAERAKVEAEWAEKVRNAEQNLANARNVLADAYEREASALQAVKDQFLGFANSIAAFRKSLYTGNAAGLNPFAAYRANRGELDAAMAGVRSGDPGAFERFQSVAQAFLSSSQGVAPNSAFLARDRALVARMAEEAEAAAKARAEEADQQLLALQAQVGLLIDLNGNVVSVKDAVNGVNSAVSALAAVEAAQMAAMADMNAAVLAAVGVAQAALQAAQNPPPAANDNRTWTASGYLLHNPDVEAEYNRHVSASDKAYLASLGVNSAADFAQWHWNNFGKTENRSFSTGGSYTVGGSGGPDSQFMPQWLTPGEVVNVTKGDTMADLADELRAVRGELSALRRERSEDARQLKRDAKDTADTLARVERGTGSLSTVAA